MIEPTETEPFETLDAFAEAMIQIAKEVEHDPETGSRVRRTVRPSAGWMRLGQPGGPSCGGAPKGPRTQQRSGGEIDVQRRGD